MGNVKKLRRIENFEKLGLGLFLHYGLYSTVGKGEWHLKTHEVDSAEYARLKDSFDPKRLDFDNIVLTAKRAGFRYIVFTARHHDGFSLYDTKHLNDYNSVKSPLKRDLVAEFVASCHKFGILPVLYHTTIDWREPVFRTDFKKYLEYLRESIKLLCTNYGSVGGFWFDGNWDLPDIDWEEDALYGLIRQYQPEALIINNTGAQALGKLGHPEIDSVTFEKGLPRPVKHKGKYIAAEMCNTVNDHWAVASNDINYKSIKNILENMVDCRKYNANYLLDFPLEAEGDFSHISLGIMEQLAKWIDVYGEVMSASSYLVSDMDDILLRGDSKLYMTVKDLGIKGDENVAGQPSVYKKVVFEGVKEKIEKIVWIDNGSEVTFTQIGERLEVNATHFNYGASLAVRVAEVRYK